jgi:hypothetical protein
MVSFRCDVFKHSAPSTEPKYLIANAGVMRGHLDRQNWELVLANAVTPTFAKKGIGERGFCVVIHTAKHREIAKSLYC